MVLLAVNVTAVPEQTALSAPATDRSATVASGLIVTDIFVLAEVFVHELLFTAST